jgi:hypothetical protein
MQRYAASQGQFRHIFHYSETDPSSTNSHAPASLPVAKPTTSIVTGILKGKERAIRLLM